MRSLRVVWKPHVCCYDIYSLFKNFLCKLKGWLNIQQYYRFTFLLNQYLHAGSDAVLLSWTSHNELIIPEIKEENISTCFFCFQPCLIQAVPSIDLSLSLQALYTKAASLPTQRAALPIACPAPGMDFPAIQTALCLRPGPPIPWTLPLAMASHLRSVLCFQTEDLLYTRTKESIPSGHSIMNCQI